jgi:hypothetical protein
MLNICLTKVDTRRRYRWTKEEKMFYTEVEPPHHLADSMNQQKETVITLDSQKLWRSIRIFWKAHQLWFPMPLSLTDLHIPIMRFNKFIADWSEGQRSSRKTILV